MVLPNGILLLVTLVTAPLDTAASCEPGPHSHCMCGHEWATSIGADVLALVPPARCERWDPHCAPTILDNQQIGMPRATARFCKNVTRNGSLKWADESFYPMNWRCKSNGEPGMFGRSPVGRIGLMFTDDGRLELGHRVSQSGALMAMPAVVPPAAVPRVGVNTSRRHGVWKHDAALDSPGFKDQYGSGCVDWVGKNCHRYRGYSMSGLAAVRAACPGACNPRLKLAFVFIHVAKSGGLSVGKGLAALGVPHLQIHTLNRGRGGAQLACIGWGVPGPISRAIQFAPAVVRTSGRFSATVLWIRDPVSRLVSTWNAEDDKHGPSRLPQLFVWAERSGNPSLAAQRASRQAFEIALQGDGNAGGSLAAYVDDIGVLDAMPPLFVGRTEHMVEDWTRLQRTYLPDWRPRAPIHSHSTKRVGRQVPVQAVLRLKEVFKQDYEVMQMLVDRGELDARYVRAMKAKTNYTY